LTVAKYIEFKKDEIQRYGGREVYAVVNKRSGTEIGNIFWYPPWRQWTARFDEDSVWSHDCLADVREFILSMSNASNQAEAGSR
jgi:hypothetical protein